MTRTCNYICLHLLLGFVCFCVKVAVATGNAHTNEVSTAATSKSSIQHKIRLKFTGNMFNFLLVVNFIWSEELLEALSESASEAKFGNILEKELALFKGQEQACGHGADSGFLALVLTRGYVETAKKIVDACIEKGELINVADLQRTANTLRRKLTEFTGFIQSANRAMSKVTPAFEWAQSADQVFISVKFAHKLDTPACIDVEVDKVDIQENAVSVAAICKGKKKEFSLVMDLLKPIHTGNSTWSMASVGRGTFTLTKQKPDTKWARLLKTRDKPKNMHVWWQLHEKYEKELEKAVKREEERNRKENEESKNEEEPQKNENGSGNEVKHETGDDVDVSQSDNAEEKEAKKTEMEAKLEEEKTKQKKIVKKAAKSEKKKLKKEKKTSLKEIDAEIADLEKKIKDAKERKTTTSKEFDTKLSKVDQNLSEDIAEIDKMTEKDLQDNDSSGSLSIFQRLKSFISSTSSGSDSDADANADAEKDEEKKEEISEGNHAKEL